MEIGVKVTKTGPFFTKKGKPMQMALERSIQDAVEMGEQRLDAILRPRPAGVYLSFQQARPGQASTGHYRRSIHGEAKPDRGRIDDSNVVYGPWLEGISSRNRTTRFPGYMTFRKTAQWLDKRLEGILRDNVRRFTRRMN